MRLSLIFIFFISAIANAANSDALLLNQYKELSIEQEKIQSKLDKCTENSTHKYPEKEAACISLITKENAPFLKRLEDYNNTITNNHKKDIEYSYYIVFCFKNTDKVLFPTTKMLLDRCDNRVPSFDTLMSGQISPARELDLLAVLCEDSYSTEKNPIKCNKEQLNEVLMFVSQKLKELTSKEDKELVKKIYPSIFFNPKIIN